MRPEAGQTPRISSNALIFGNSGYASADPALANSSLTVRLSVWFSGLPSARKVRRKISATRGSL